MKRIKSLATDKFNRKKNKKDNLDFNICLNYNNTYNALYLNGCFEIVFFFSENVMCCLFFNVSKLFIMHFK